MGKYVCIFLCHGEREREREKAMRMRYGCALPIALFSLVRCRYWYREHHMLARAVSSYTVRALMCSYISYYYYYSYSYQFFFFQLVTIKMIWLEIFILGDVNIICTSQLRSSIFYNFFLFFSPLSVFVAVSCFFIFLNFWNIFFGIFSV